MGGHSHEAVVAGTRSGLPRRTYGAPRRSRSLLGSVPPAALRGLRSAD